MFWTFLFGYVVLSFIFLNERLVPKKGMLRMHLIFLIKKEKGLRGKKLCVCVCVFFF